MYIYLIYLLTFFLVTSDWIGLDWIGRGARLPPNPFAINPSPLPTPVALWPQWNLPAQSMASLEKRMHQIGWIMT